MTDDKKESEISISKFKSNVSNEFAKTSLFHVEIDPPDKISQNVEFLKFTCDQAQIPGYTLKAEERTIAGITTEMPMNFALEKLQLSFLVRGDMTERKFFDQWFGCIMVNQKGLGYKMGYFNEYVGEIRIKVYDLTGSVVYSVKCLNCYPQTLTSQTLNWSEDTIIRLTVDFAYEEWEVEKKEKK